MSGSPSQHSPSPLHATLVSALARRPERIEAMARALLGRTLGPLAVADSTLHRRSSDEVRPDLVFRTGAGSGWLAVEVKLGIDEAKARRWPMAMSLLRDQKGAMGDLLVLTPSRSVARWARAVADGEGPLGTVMSLRPVVLCAAEHLERLLDPRSPSLALLAAFAVAHRRGPRALDVVVRALACTQELPVALRREQMHAILTLLGHDLSRLLRTAMNTAEGHSIRTWVDELEEKGFERGIEKGIERGIEKGIARLREVLGRQLATRFGPLPNDAEARIAAASADELVHWLDRVLTADTVEAALGGERSPPRE